MPSLDDDDHMADARKRVDAASEEAVSLAIDAMHDRVLEQAIWERIRRQSAIEGIRRIVARGRERD